MRSWKDVMELAGLEKAIADPAEQWLAERGWDTPEAMRGLLPEEVDAALEGAPGATRLAARRALALGGGAPATARREGAVPPLPRCAWALASVIQDFPRWKVDADKRCSAAGLRGAVDMTAGPRAVCRQLAAAPRNGAKVEDALELRARVNTLMTVERSLAQVASGLRCWAAYCDAAGVSPHFPAAEEDVVRFTAVFRCGQTLPNYLRHLKLAHRLLREPVVFETEHARAAGRGVKRR